MKTQTQKTELIQKSNLEVTSNLQNALDIEEALMFTTCNQSEDRSLSIQYIEFGEVGKERVSDWMRFVNSLNNYDDTPIKRMITGDKKSLDYGGAIISRCDVDYSEDGFLIEFKEPVKLVVEEIGDNYLTIEVNTLKGKFSWEWYSRRNGHEALGNISGICEIFLTEIEIIN